jgi:hypothetical protein
MTDPERQDLSLNLAEGSGLSEPERSVLSEGIPGRGGVDHSKSREARKELQEARQREWEEVLLYEALVRGPEVAEDTPWDKTLDKLAEHIGDNGRVLLHNLIDPEPVDENNHWDMDLNDRYLEKFRQVRSRLIYYLQSKANSLAKETDEELKILARKDLDQLAREASEALKAQGRQPRFADQVRVDYLNAGTVTRYNDDLSSVTDIHGRTSLVPNDFLPEAVTSSDNVLVERDLHPDRVLNLRRNHCVRLITDAYEDRGMPKGIEGYVTNLVSNEALGWPANNCQIMVVLEHLGKDIPWSEDFLEVTESEIERCTKENPPSEWFPFETSEDGLVETTPLGFKVKPDAKTYTYEELFVHLTGKPPT